MDENIKNLYNQSLERVNELVSENTSFRNSLEEYRMSQQTFNMFGMAIDNYQYHLYTKHA